MKQLFFILLSMAFVHSSKAQDIKAYSKFDFLPGREIVYFNNFDGEEIGQLPTGWNTNGSGEVVRLHNQPWIRLMQNATFITDNSNSFPANFTVEFDLLLDFKGTDALFPQVSFGMLSSGQQKPNSNATLQNMLQAQLVGVDLHAGIEHNSIAKLVSFNAGTEYFHSGEKPFKQLETLLTKTMHVSFQVQQQRLRVWINEIKLFDVPNALPEKTSINQLFFRVFEGGFSNEQVGVYVTNIKVAKGVNDARSHLMAQGRFSTTGILFQVNSAEIRPASYTVLKEIAAVLKENPSLKFLIVGHTDSDGNDADNLQLSQKRSAAVKQFLVTEFGLDGSRFTTEGKGEQQPVAPNTTREGKSQNRRVEFIKQ